VSNVLFYIFCALIIGCGALAVTLKHLLHAALALMAALFCTAGLFILLHAEFVALVQIMVYIGGVVIFIIYTILLTAHLGEKPPPIHIHKHLLAGFVAVVFGVVMTTLVVRAGSLGTGVHDPHNVPGLAAGEPGSLHVIGQRLLSNGPDGFVVPFEVISVLLLAALIGAVSIARRTRAEEGQL
jgi:NADH-quinone oxidoreductase subunit J